MAAKVLVTETGRVRCGPGEKIVTCMKDTKIEWRYPILEKGDENYDPDTTVPKRWRVLVKEMGGKDLEKRLNAQAEKVEDPQAGREKDSMQTERGANAGDQELIRQAIASLEDDDPEHWTARGDPKVDMVQLFVEQFEKDNAEKSEGPPLAEGYWPDWVTRKTIELASGGKG